MVGGTSFTTALVSGALAGTAVDTLFFPLDTLKTRLQSAQGFTAAGAFNGVYRGLSSAVIGSAPGAAAFFTTYEKSKHNLKPFINQAPLLHMTSASIGEIAACLIRVPTENVKQRSQTASSRDLGKLMVVVTSLWHSQGLGGFYRGFTTTVSREIPFTCIQFPLYESLKLLLVRRRTQNQSTTDSSQLPAIQAAVCGSFAGGLAAAVTTPLDVAKTRIMLSSSSSSSTGGGPSSSSVGVEVGGGTIPTTPPARRTHYPTSFPKTLAIIAREEGVGALFTGIVPRVMWISLGGFVFLGVYEWSKKLVGGVTGEGKAVEGL
ncbi:mitochondrial carrier [Meredithblackwellia eburnea MCA 4105]